MGWADLLGPGNAFQQFVASNRGKLGQIGAGLGSGQNFSAGLANAAQAMPQGQATDDAYATQQAAEAERAQQINQTAAFLQSKGYDDLLPLVGAGQGAVALTEAMKRMQPGYAQANAPKPIEVGGVLLDPTTYQPIFDSRKPDTPAVPSGYQMAPNGAGLTYIPGGPADPSTPAKTTEATRRNQQLSSMIGPELQTVEQNWDELASGTNQAANAVPFGAGYGATSPGYQQATNALGTIAQSYLYSVSGAAAPAEEVRKLVESVTPRPFESQESINAKRARVRQMAAAVQEAAGGAPAQQQQSPGGQTSSGLSWSIEP